MSRNAPRTEDEILRESLAHLELARTYASGDLAEQMAIDAICMRLAAGIEVLAQLPVERLQELFRDDWKLMWGMRNRIAHGYLRVDRSIILSTVHDELPAIVSALQGGLRRGPAPR